MYAYMGLDDDQNNIEHDIAPTVNISMFKNYFYTYED